MYIKQGIYDCDHLLRQRFLSWNSFGINDSNRVNGYQDLQDAITF